MSTNKPTAAASLSINDLPGDNWETRFSKQVARNIAFFKGERGLTTKKLAEACNEIHGEADYVKVSTLNGLFAGKRKSIGVAELLVFAQALKVPPVFLLLPLAQGEDVQVSPGVKMSPYSAYTYFTAQQQQPIEITSDGKIRTKQLFPHDAYTFESERAILHLWERHENALADLRFMMEHWLGKLMVANENAITPDPLEMKEKFEKPSRTKLQELSDIRARLRAKGLTPPQLIEALVLIDQEPMPDLTLPLQNFVEESGVLRERERFIATAEILKRNNESPA